MTWKGFLIGLACGLAIWFIAARIHTAPKVVPDETIIFGDKAFYDSAVQKRGIDSFVQVSGTLKANGDKYGPAYKNNSMTIQCLKETSYCVIGSVDQIGLTQVGNVNMEDWPITKWDSSEIEAQNVELCATVTITINRTSQEVAYVIVPTNLTIPFCLENGNKEIHKWSVGRSLLRERNEAKIKTP